MELDEFLKPGRSYERLLREYHKYEILFIGVDFDETLYDYHKKGNSYEMVRELVRDLKSIGCTICIWTANKDLKFVAKFCQQNNIPFDNINEGGIKLGWETKKPLFNVLIDDRAGLRQVYEDLIKLVQEVKKSKTYAKV